jgi:hypothetical protein
MYYVLITPLKAIKAFVRSGDITPLILTVGKR